MTKVIAGRAEPVPGTRRHRLMKDVEAWLQTHQGSHTTYSDIAAGLVVGETRVRGAVADLQRFGTNAISIPTSKNGWNVHMEWDNDARLGEANQSRHLASRLESSQVRKEHGAAETTDPAERAMLLVAAAANESLQSRSG